MTGNIAYASRSELVAAGFLAFAVAVLTAQLASRAEDPSEKPYIAPMPIESTVLDEGEGSGVISVEASKH